MMRVVPIERPSELFNAASTANGDGWRQPQNNGGHSSAVDDQPIMQLPPPQIRITSGETAMRKTEKRWSKNGGGAGSGGGGGHRRSKSAPDWERRQRTEEEEEEEEEVDPNARRTRLVGGGGGRIWHLENILHLQTDGPLRAPHSKRFGKRHETAEQQSTTGANLCVLDKTHHSPSMKSNITIPKKRYSIWRRDSLIDIAIPEFTKTDRRQRKSVPSSPRTVLALSGLFVCGLMLVLSGTIVISSPPHLLSLRLVGGALLGIGLCSLLICAFVQRKNVVKWMGDMTRDLFALREATDPCEPINNAEEEEEQEEQQQTNTQMDNRRNGGWHNNR